MTKKKENIIWSNVDVDDERANLNIGLAGNILIIASLGLWSGRKSGYKIISNNIKDIFSTACGDSVKWYADGKNIKCEDHHHDGTNYYTYREIRENVDISKLTDKIYNNEEISEKEINKYTKSIRPYVAKTYGW